MLPEKVGSAGGPAVGRTCDLHRSGRSLQGALFLQGALPFGFPTIRS